MKDSLFVTIIMLVFIAMFAFYSTAYGQSERDYQDAWCNDKSGVAELRLADKARVDCVIFADDASPRFTYAFEFDFAKKWAEAIGQSLYYSAVLSAIPGVVLIMKDEKDCKYLERFYKATTGSGAAIVLFETGEFANKCKLSSPMLH